MIIKAFRSILSVSAVLITIVFAVGGYQLALFQFRSGVMGLIIGAIVGFLVATWFTGYFLTVVDNRDINKRNQELLEEILEQLRN
jgi:hypothetical protein